ncbi:MAG: M50 family metallopeptidase [Planctomycetia bacterium]|nr:M50 family metallopeptidase [Planctomycetia bacterium]
MSWRDRDYNRGYGGGWGGGGSILALFSWALPLGTFFGIRIQASFWLLLLIAFELLYVLHTGALVLALLAIVGILLALFIHELGHRFAAQWVGGRHDDFLMWPCGNMIPPAHPPAAWPMFAAQSGGIFANVITAMSIGTIVNIIWHIQPAYMAAILGQLQPDPVAMSLPALAAALYMFCMANIFLIVINLLPFYWFDGAYLLQAILWPISGAYKSVDFTCLTGLVVAAGLFMLSAYGMSFMGMLMCGLLFYDSWQRRQALRADGPGVIDQLISSSANISDLPAHKRRRLLQRWLHWISRREHRSRQEQQIVDKILEKVSEKGMHSLTRKERRILHRATQRQREADLISQR